MRIFFLIFTLLCCCNSLAHAEEGAIVAIVGDDIVTTLDVEKRLQLLTATAPIPEAEKNSSKLRSQVLQTLMDERLIAQEAKRLKITISREESVHAISVLEQQNNVPAGQFEAFLAQKRIPQPELMAQLRAQMLWTKIVNYTLRPKISVTQEEIAEAAKEALPPEPTAPSAAPLRGDAIIGLKQVMLAIRPKESAASIKKRALQLDALRDKIHSCNDIAAVARQVRAESSTEMSDVQLSSLQPAIRDAIATLGAGKVSPVITTAASIQVIVICSVKNSEGQAATPTPVAAAPQAPGVVDKNRIGNMLLQRKMELQAKHYLRDLKRKAYIEIVH
jgi:peptidyl-prolyl cis-trans isomerase SurA